MKNDTIIVAIAGRKQSGKSSLCEYIKAQHYVGYSVGVVSPADRPFLSQFLEFNQQSDGNIVWKNGYAGNPNLRPTGSSQDDCRIYSFADTLKDVCVNVLGLKPEQCYGTDEQKNTLTSFKWDSLPEYVRWVAGGKQIRVFGDHPQLGNGLGSHLLYTTLQGFPYSFLVDSDQLFPKGFLVTDERLYKLSSFFGLNPCWWSKSGFMTAREVMQVFGTDVMRKMFFDGVWVEATLNRIKRDAPRIALISDMRFRSEFSVLYQSGAFVIRLERNILHDTHVSETDFDDFKWDQHERCLVIPESCDIHEKNQMALLWLNANVRLFADTSEYTK